MLKTAEALCRSCRTLALPLCSCGALGAKHSDMELLIFSNNLSKVSLTNVWWDNLGRLLWLEETDFLSKARVSNLPDIHFTKD